ncbi:MAG TPA: c-type cytochrome [Acidimicrobiia bacterium]|nr:c-type cytochrome [Acidimicrobiia bacterium]
MKRLIGMLIVGVLLTSACGGSDGDSDDTSQTAVAAGHEVFTTACQACHGTTGEGVTGLGSNLQESQFVRDTSDVDLAAFLEVGLSADDPANTIGIAMPAKGGRTTLTTDDLSNVVAYLRTINS